MLCSNTIRSTRCGCNVSLRRAGCLRRRRRRACCLRRHRRRRPQQRLRKCAYSIRRKCPFSIHCRRCIVSAGAAACLLGSARWVRNSNTRKLCSNARRLCCDLRRAGCLRRRRLTCPYFMRRQRLRRPCPQSRLRQCSVAIPRAQQQEECSVAIPRAPMYSHHTNYMRTATI